MNHLGETRSVFRHDHLLHTPDTFVRAPLPGMTNGTAITHCAPAIGAKFAQYTAELSAGGTLWPAIGQRFVYVLEGSATVEIANHRHDLAPGGFAYVPEEHGHTLAAKTSAKLAVIEKRYTPVKGLATPAPVFGNESSTLSEALMGDEDLRVRALLPCDAAFDFAVNIMSYQPGSSLSMVEVHVMEHGLLMLEGGGNLPLGQLLVSGAKRRFHLDARILPAMVRSAWQDSRKIFDLQRLESVTAGVNPCDLQLTLTVLPLNSRRLPGSRMQKALPSLESLSPRQTCELVRG